MTSNQIAYWKLQEDQRSHRENESIGRADNVSKRISAEASRSQADTAVINAATKKKEQEETARHNKAQENLKGTEIGVKAATDIFGSVVKIFK